MILSTNEHQTEVAEQQNSDLALAMRELGELELALVGGGTGAVIWA